MTLPRHPAVHLERALAGGSSWPIVVRDDAGARWLVKLRGNAHGAAPLVAEIIVGELAAALGLAVPARARPAPRCGGAHTRRLRNARGGSRWPWCSANQPRIGAASAARSARKVTRAAAIGAPVASSRTTKWTAVASSRSTMRPSG